MSHSSSPNNRASIFGWVKNLKKGNLTSNDSLNEPTSDNENISTHSKSPTKQSHTQQDHLVPFLRHKSRSTNNVNRVRSNSLNYSDKNSTIRQHRDSFLQNNPLIDEDSKYFGVPLEEAISQSSAKISIFTSDSPSNVLQYGKVPIIVAKCGLYIKNKGLDVEGIFRVGGSSKRLKELQVIFNTGPDFGKKLDWDGYTVHDAASILRRYLNALPEPLIPLDFYEIFREPLKNRPRISQYLKYKAENPSKSSLISGDPSKTKGIEEPTTLPVIEINATNVPNNELDSAKQATSVAVTGDRNEQEERPKNEYPSAMDVSKASVDGSGAYFIPPEIKVDSSTGSSEVTLNGKEPPSESFDNELKVSTDSMSKNTASKKGKKYTKLTSDIYSAIDDYKDLLEKLPILSRQLLFYILDLLAMVQNHSNENLMSSRNLAAIFQPSLLTHPDHDMNPEEYALSASVVEFLIHYAYKLLPENQDGLKKAQGEYPTSEIGESSKKQNAKSSADEGSLAAKISRKHSKSLSSTLNNEDLIGYKSSLVSRTFPIIDTDADITDDEVSDVQEMSNDSNLAS